MNAAGPPIRDREYRLATWFVLTAALVVALVSARPYAGSWNDGSRLATVESLVDHGTLAIDRSIFVQVPPRRRPDDPGPYPADDPVLQHGTRDRLYIQGHFYSDKSPVPALLMAGLYQGLQWATGLTARERPDLFCYLMTVCTSGLAYLVAIWSVLRLGRLVRLPPGVRLVLAASLGLATVALTYTRHVNNHILLLGVTAPLLVGLVGLADDVRTGRLSWWRLVGIGSLAGLGYSIDLGAGLAILPATMVLIVYRIRAFRPIALCVLAALPWIVLHHVVNYAIGGTLRPANAVPAYLVAAGGGFTSQNMTGLWNHSNVGKFLLYAASLLFGKRGFFGHNLPLFLTLPALVFLIRRRPRELPEILCALAWSVGTWLVYAVGSTNSSGLAVSIRWFVPLLAPAYYLAALFLRERPGYRADFIILSAWGLVMAALMWWKGPWMPRMVPLFWPLQAAALMSWLIYRLRQRGHATDMGARVLGETARGGNAE
jgi:hypothetical protein